MLINHKAILPLFGFRYFVIFWLIYFFLEQALLELLKVKIQAKMLSVKIFKFLCQFLQIVCYVIVKIFQFCLDYQERILGKRVVWLTIDRCYYFCPRLDGRLALNAATVLRMNSLGNGERRLPAHLFARFGFRLLWRLLFFGFPWILRSSFLFLHQLLSKIVLLKIRWGFRHRGVSKWRTFPASFLYFDRLIFAGFRWASLKLLYVVLNVSWIGRVVFSLGTAYPLRDRLILLW